MVVSLLTVWQAANAGSGASVTAPVSAALIASAETPNKRSGDVRYGAVWVQRPARKILEHAPFDSVKPDFFCLCRQILTVNR
jgi:hypothetical protein